MPLNPGSSSVTFTPPGQFVVDRLHKVPASQGLSSFPQAGCNIQTTTVKDRVDDTAYAEATHRIYTPFNANTAAVDAEWYIVDANNKKYRVMGAHRIPDAWGRVYQCEFISKLEEG